MEFRILKASDWNFRDKKTFSTIEELKDYINAVNPERKSCVIYLVKKKFGFMILGLSEVTMISLGRNIKKHMVDQKVTGRELARYIGVQENQVSRWLNDKNVPSADALYEVARYLGVTVEQLFTERTE